MYCLQIRIFVLPSFDDLPFYINSDMKFKNNSVSTKEGDTLNKFAQI